ncbi:MAG: glyoxylate/hydroxypyruvate reductase A [Burkholderiaceae bacterium]|nr:glyoxylate/hydroxypyruvate reductase A [Burkholderiaceae bacterium]
MKVIFAAKDNITPEHWLPPLQQALPDMEIVAWQPDGPAINADFAVVWTPPAELFLRETRLKAVFNLGAGVDALFRSPGLPADLPVIRLEDAGMAVQIAEYVIYALLRASRSFDQYQGIQQQSLWQPLPAIQRELWSVGVMGTGVIGSRVAQAVAALEYPVASWSRSGKAMPGVTSFAGAAQLPEFLQRTKVLVNTLPLTSETAGILCRSNMQQLQPPAYIINVGRGGHLVEDDLLALLESGHLKGATLDVFQQEPLPKTHPFWMHPGITITPHISGASLRATSIAQVAAKIQAFLRGEPLTGLVQRDRGY